MIDILKKINENTSKYPERIFYKEIIDGGLLGNTLTWKKLNEYSDALAKYMDEVCTSKQPVMVYGHKSPYMVVCFLACMKSGRAYCPLDFFSIPKSRVIDIIDEVQPEIILMPDNGLDDDYSLTCDSAIILKDKLNEIYECKGDIEKLKPLSISDNCYIIFTSGSSGKPKGVQISYGCLCNYVEWAVTLLDEEFNKGYVFLNQAPFSFDLSVMDLYLALYTGGTLAACCKSVQGDYASLMAGIQKVGINVWVSTPSFADMCLMIRIFNEELLPKLKTFLFCGEVLTNKTVQKLYKRFPNVKIINTYGPTESTVCMTSVLVDEKMSNEISPLPVGIVKTGTWVYIWNEKKECVKDGEQGEIVIVGNTVSSGYLNRPDLNQEKFGTIEVNNKVYRFYRTGDKGYLKDGMLFYTGRMDSQIKLHGYRIEIEDVESNLMKASNVSQVAVYANEKNGKVEELVACVVLKNYNAEAQCSELIKLREELKGILPYYMIPKKIRIYDSLPMTTNGKVDRKKLKDMNV